MKTRRLLWVLPLVALLGFGEKPWPYFVQPPGWPKPLYDFDKHPQTEAGFALGRALFYEPMLSLDSSTSCASCHTPQTAFAHVDHTLSHGIKGRIGTRNAPALMNLAWNRSYHWDGGVHHLEVQPLNPLTHPAEMGNTLPEVLKRLQDQPRYRKALFRSFGDSAITGQRMLQALAQFTVGLQSYRSRYDRYTRQEPGAELTPQELNGLVLFRKNCTACHPEPLFTDYSFARILPPDPDLRDPGRYAITRNPADSFAFRVPSLRNVAFTYPYMHDGRFGKLRQVLDFYTDTVQPLRSSDPRLTRPIRLSATEKKDVIAFLLTLSDTAFLFDKRYAYRAD